VLSKDSAAATVLSQAGAAGERDQAGAGQRTHERHGAARGGPQDGQDGRGQAREGAGDQEGHRERVGEREREHDPALPVPVGEPAHQRPAGDLAERQRPAGESRGGQ
jgi:hypothetical protein